MCIYFVHDSYLNYNSQEHIIPQALGGIKELPKGFVSDEFNNSISSFEGQVIRNSIIAAPREFEGPGKKGSLSPRHAKKSIIILAENLAEGKPFALGYIQKGDYFQIDHLILNTTSNTISFSTNSGEENIKSLIEKFLTLCSSPENLRLKVVVKDELPQHLILFGIYEGYALFFKNTLNTLNLSPELLLRISEANLNSSPQKEDHYFKFTRDYRFDTSDTRLWGKIAFNYLSYLMGYDFVLDKQFDPLRNWIINGDCTFSASFDFNNVDTLKSLIADKAHYIQIWSKGNELYARVALYSLPVNIMLSNKYEGKIDLKTFVCDWRKRDEYDFMDRLNESAIKRMSS